MILPFPHLRKRLNSLVNLLHLKPAEPHPYGIPLAPAVGFGKIELDAHRFGPLLQPRQVHRRFRADIDVQPSPFADDLHLVAQVLQQRRFHAVVFLAVQVAHTAQVAFPVPLFYEQLQRPLDRQRDAGEVGVEAAVFAQQAKRQDDVAHATFAPLSSG